MLQVTELSVPVHEEEPDQENETENENENENGETEENEDPENEENEDMDELEEYNHFLREQQKRDLEKAALAKKLAEEGDGTVDPTALKDGLATSLRSRKKKLPVKSLQSMDFSSLFDKVKKRTQNIPGLNIRADCLRRPVRPTPDVPALTADFDDDDDFIRIEPPVAPTPTATTPTPTPTATPVPSKAVTPLITTPPKHPTIPSPAQRTEISDKAPDQSTSPEHERVTNQTGLNNEASDAKQITQETSEKSSDSESEGQSEGAGEQDTARPADENSDSEKEEEEDKEKPEENNQTANPANNNNNSNIDNTNNDNNDEESQIFETKRQPSQATTDEDSKNIAETTSALEGAMQQILQRRKRRIEEVTPEPQDAPRKELRKTPTLVNGRFATANDDKAAPSQQPGSFGAMLRGMVDAEAEENDEEADMEMFGRVMEHKLKGSDDEEEEEDAKDDGILEDLIDQTMADLGGEEAGGELHDQWEEEADKERLKAVVRGIKTGQWRRADARGRRGGLDEDDENYEITDDMFMDDEEAEMQYIQLLQQLAKERKLQRKKLNEWQQGGESFSAESLARMMSQRIRGDDENEPARPLTEAELKLIREQHKRRKLLLRARSRHRVDSFGESQGSESAGLAGTQPHTDSQVSSEEPQRNFISETTAAVGEVFAGEGESSMAPDELEILLAAIAPSKRKRLRVNTKSTDDGSLEDAAGCAIQSVIPQRSFISASMYSEDTQPAFDSTDQPTTTTSNVPDASMRGSAIGGFGGSGAAVRIPRGPKRFIFTRTVNVDREDSRASLGDDGRTKQISKLKANTNKSNGAGDGKPQAKLQKSKSLLGALRMKPARVESISND